MRFMTSLCVGLLLLIAGAWGAYASIGAGASQWKYYLTKYAEKPLPVDRVLSVCERAQRQYPHNYYFAEFAAARALEAAFEADSSEECGLLMGAADHWSEVAVRTNPYLSNMAFTRTRVLEKNGQIEDAVALWRTVVDAEIWNPSHHDYMARLFGEIFGEGNRTGSEGYSL